MEAPVVGATGMMAAKTTRPIATPANPAAALRWMTPKMVNTRMNVPTNSAVNACATLTVSALYAATPRPTSLACWPSTPMMAAAPTIAPTTWAPMYAGTWLQGNLPVTASPSVTAGLMWLPPMCPRA